jgi:hypothetical protein
MPSTDSAGMPKAPARPVMEPATLAPTGSVVAYKLFSQMKTTGTRQSAARLKDSSSAPWLTAPSPNTLTATRSLPARASAHAAPAASGAPCPTDPDDAKTPTVKSEG